MSTVTRRTLFGKTMLLAGFLSASCMWSGVGHAEDTIKIGGAFNLTGGGASQDGPSKNGAQMAIDKINAAGGVDGKKLELVVYDGKTDPAVEASIATQMIDSDKVSVMMGFSDSDPVLAVGPLAQRAGIPFISIGATSPKLPDQIGDGLFLACFGDNTQAAVGATFAIDTLKAKKVYILEDTGMEYTTLLSRYFQETFEHLGGTTVGHETYRTGDKTFTAQITKIRASAEKPDFLFVSAGPAEVGLIIRQIRQAGLKMPIIGGDGFDTPLLIEIAGSAADNVYYTTHALISEDGSDLAKQFYADYKAKYGRAPETAFAALGYDTVFLVADAIKRAGSSDPKAVRDALQKTQGLSSVTGTISYTATSRIPVKGVTVVGIKDKKRSVAAEIVPTFVPAP